MPIFEYACEDCEKTFEALVLDSSEAVMCPRCGSTGLRKLISAHAVGRAHAAPACVAPTCDSSAPCGTCPAMQ